LKNLNNFDLCLFFDIPVSSKSICLCGFDNDNDYKNKIKSLIINNIVNNYKTRIHYTNIIVNYYSSNKNNKLDCLNINLNKYFSSNSRYAFNYLDSIEIMQDYLKDMKKIKKLNTSNDDYSGMGTNNKTILSILILDSIDFANPDEKSIIQDLVLNHNKYKLWIIGDFVCDLDSDSDSNLQNKLIQNFEYKIYSSNSTPKQIEKYYINDFVECVSDIKYIYNTFKKFEKKQIHLVTLREKYKNSIDLYIKSSSNSSYETKDKSPPQIMGFVPYKINKPIENSFCESEQTPILNSSESKLNLYKGHRINIFNENKMNTFNKNSPNTDYMDEISTNTNPSNSIKSSNIKKSPDTDYMVEYLINDEKINKNKIQSTSEIEINNKKNISYSTDYLVRYLKTSEKSSNDKPPVKLSNKDIFIKKQKNINQANINQANINPTNINQANINQANINQANINPTNIKFKIGSNVSIQINF
jgi:hypothetical protein